MTKEPYDPSYGEKDPPPFSSIPGFDSRADWLFGAGRDDFLIDGPKTRIPFSIRLPDDQAISDFETFRQRFEKEFKEELEEVGGLSLHIPNSGALVPKRTFTGFAPSLFFEALRRSTALSGIIDKDITFGQPFALKSSALPPPGFTGPLDEPPIQAPETSDRLWPEDTVIVAVIDDGIAFAHERFRDDSGRSRVQCFWRQDGPFEATGSTVWFGREICKHNSASGEPGIDSLLASSQVGSMVDEDQFYRKAKVVDFTEAGHKSSAWRRGHGGHVMDLAAGEMPSLRPASTENRPIIAVQLPVSVTANPIGGGAGAGGLEIAAIEAVKYILERAAKMSAFARGPLPVVINFSYGLFSGPHDGTDNLERFLDAQDSSYAGDLRIVLPAGNSHLSRAHVAFTEADFPSGGDMLDLKLRVQPDDRTASFVEFWLPCEGSNPVRPTTSRIEIKVIAPDSDGTWATLDERGTTPAPIERNGIEYGTLEYQFDLANSKRGFFLLALHPTARLAPNDKIAPHGLWTIQVRKQVLPAGAIVDAWVERDVRLHGYPLRGRQAYFDDETYQRFDPQGRPIEEDDHPAQVASPSPVKRAGLLNGIATGEHVIVAGGFRRKEQKVAHYSSGGPISVRCGGIPPNPATDPRKPDAVLVSDDSKVHSGVLAAGTRSNARVAINGTSVAAPQLARWIANDLADGGTGDRTAVKTAAKQMTSPPPNDRSGSGTIDYDDVDGLPILELPRFYEP